MRVGAGLDNNYKGDGLTKRPLTAMMCVDGDDLVKDGDHDIKVPCDHL